jgi:dUTP pyrophosphatase
VKYKKLREVKSPVRAYPTDAGFDCFAPETFSVPPLRCFPDGTGEAGFFRAGTALAFEIPHGYCLRVDTKSSAGQQRLAMNIAGVVDEGYVGEVHVMVFNFGGAKKTFKKGEKMCQLVLEPVEYCDLEETTGELKAGVRGARGFGSSGQV